MEFRKLKVYNLAIDFTKDVYKLAEKIPEEEKFGLTSQLKRASVSVALNIAEGSGSSSNQEFSRFLKMSVRSLYEVDAILELIVKLGYTERSEISKIYKKRMLLGRMLGSFINKLKT